MGRIGRDLYIVAVVSLLLTACEGPDRCHQAAEQMARCGESAPPTFIDGCQQNPEWADAILQSDCSSPMGGKSEGGVGSWLAPPTPFVPATKATRLLVQVASRTLTLFDREDNILALYDVGFGWGESFSTAGKKVEGDGRTPRGVYRLFSAFANQYKLFMLVSYPNAVDAARGLDAGLITQSEHDAIISATAAGIVPPQKTNLGGEIGIHGFGTKLSFVPQSLQHLHPLINMTRGCILVTDAEVEVLAKSYEPGAILEIR